MKKVLLLLAFGPILFACAAARLPKNMEAKHRQFLSEARYTITGQERRVFSNLPPSERDAFVEEFWKKRDPEPGDRGQRVQGRVLTSGSKRPTASSRKGAATAGLKTGAGSTSCSDLHGRGTPTPGARPFTGNRPRSGITASFPSPLSTTIGTAPTTSTPKRPADRPDQQGPDGPQTPGPARKDTL